LNPDLQLLRSGKVRDLYAWRDELWLVASDRISAYDVIMPTPLPGKGKILTQLSRFWFEKFSDLVPNQILSYDLPPAVDLPEWSGRLVRAKECRVIPMECVARGYLAGSGWKEYQQQGTVGGHPVPAGLLESAQLPEPLFTPARKNHAGHDENLTEGQARAFVSSDLYFKLKTLTLKLYFEAAAYAATRGIIIADTKFEFGLHHGEILLIDEVLTPDSSRFWPADQYAPGRGQPSFDKQFLRDYLATLNWNQQPPGPDLPPEIVAQTLAKYQEAWTRLTSTQA
jgi:phosphoribosylaminoimidazole-succinocarboxamide synthase